jgi:hypothetical protein
MVSGDVYKLYFHSKSQIMVILQDIPNYLNEQFCTPENFDHSKGGIDVTSCKQSAQASKGRSSAP